MNIPHRNLPPITKYRRKCKGLAIIDLVWRVYDLANATFLIFSSKLGGQDLSEDENVLYNVVEVMDNRVYNFLLSPFLTLIYFFGFFLQFSSSVFLCSACNENSLHETERAACRVWSRIAVMSIIFLIIRFFLPYAMLTVFNITYNVVRVFFKFIGIYIVVLHENEMDRILAYFDSTGSKIESGRNRESSSSTNYCKNEDLSETGSRKESAPSSSRAYTVNESNQQFIRPRVHRAMLLVEKDMYEKALHELKVAQSYDPKNVDVAVLLKTVENITRIISEPSQDYYGLLGVSKSQTQDDIKRAFRRKSLRHHPDKHFTASEKIKTREGKLYQDIREAYDTLQDPRRRDEYDEKRIHDQEALVEYKKVFKATYAAFDAKHHSSIV